jgi:ABC-type multidrug transport system fused ATPase/permease subunit
MSYSALGGELNVQKVYTCLAILNITRLPIALFPMARAAAIEATTSLERVRKYLLLPELRRQCAISVTGGDLGSDDVSPGGTNSSDKSIELTTVPQTQNSDVLVSIRGGYFNWIENDDDEVKVPGMPPAQRRDDYLSVSIREDAPASEENKTEHAADPSADKLARCTLKNIDLTINRGDLVAIVGSVGAG